MLPALKPRGCWWSLITAGHAVFRNVIAVGGFACGYANATETHESHFDFILLIPKALSLVLPSNLSIPQARLIFLKAFYARSASAPGVIN
uniref:Arginine/serine-rich splicing factor n=1 Tax=Rhizophora mucronata TaxID=61149 RepID=A0A2P2Q7S2_RHIMU